MLQGLDFVFFFLHINFMVKMFFFTPALKAFKCGTYEGFIEIEACFYRRLPVLFFVLNIQYVHS